MSETIPGLLSAYAGGVQLHTEPARSTDMHTACLLLRMKNVLPISGSGRNPVADTRGSLDYHQLLNN